MKYIMRIAGAILLISILAACGGKIDNFVYEPEYPSPSKQLEIKYNPEGTKLEGVDNVELFYFQSDGKNLHTESILMKKEGDTFTATITPEKTTRAIVFKFVSDELEDTNNKNGYRLLYHLNYQKPIKGARLAMADLIFKRGYTTGVEMSPEVIKQAYDYLEEEFDEYPESRKDNLKLYYNVLAHYMGKKGEIIIKEEINKALSRNDLSEDEIKAMLFFSNVFSFQEETKGLNKLLAKIDKTEEKSVQDEFTKFSRETDIDKKIELLNIIKQKDKDSRYLVFAHTDILKFLGDKEDIKKIDSYITQHAEARYYVPEVYKSVAEKLLKNGDKKARLFAEKSVEYARLELENPSGKKSDYISSRQWKTEREESLAKCLKTYSEVLEKTGDKNNALETITEAIKLTKKEDKSINEVYAAMLLENGQAEKSVSEISDFITSNFATEKMDALLEEAYSKTGKSETQLQADLSNLKMKGKENLKNKLMKELEEYTAPAFTLKDLDGKTVRLSDYKGKIVLLDFWATWCPPCRASFPTMKKVIEKYKDKNDIEVVFINTREPREERVKRIKQFLDKNYYPFYVLLDDENNSTNMAYKVSGIPTKLIIDKEGNVRYFHIGWSGDEAAEMQKLDILFEIIGQ